MTKTQHPHRLHNFRFIRRALTAVRGSKHQLETAELALLLGHRPHELTALYGELVADSDDARDDWED